MEQEISTIIQQVFIKLRAIGTVSSVTVALITLDWESGDLGSNPSLAFTKGVSWASDLIQPTLTEFLRQIKTMRVMGK